MITFDPIPLLEAYTYLTVRSADISHPAYYDTNTYFNLKMLSQPDRTDEFGSYMKLLSAIENRLDSSITVDADTLKTLFAPMNIGDTSNGDTPSSSICDIMTDYCNLMVADDFNKFFALVEGSFPELPERILYALGIDINDAAPSSKDEYALDQLSLIKRINESVRSNDSKMALIELVLDPKKYLAMLKDAIVPVAKEFVRCRELWSEFIEIYRSECMEYADQPSLLNGISATVCNPDPAVTDVHPLVMGYSRMIDFIRSEEGGRSIVAMGVLFDIIDKRKNPEADVLSIMNVLSESKRFYAARMLAKRSAYTSEVARELGISVVTASQHLGILQGAGIVTARKEGTRVYYSLNYTRLKFFIDRFAELFPGAEEQSEEPAVKLPVRAYMGGGAVLNK